jgi:hypothetical protein
MSNLAGAPPGVEFDTADLDDGQLKRRSKIVASKIYCLSQCILIDRIGKLNEAVFKTVLLELDQVLGR